MPKTNKKTKSQLEKIKSAPKRKTAILKKQSAKTSKKSESILGASSEILNSGIKIPVREEKLVAEVAAAEPIVQENLIEEVKVEPEQPAQILTIEEEPVETEEDYYKQNQMIDLTPRQKNIIMYVGIGAIMSVLIVFWGLSVKNSLSQGLANSNQSIDYLGQFKQSLNQIEANLNTDNTNSADNTDAAKQQLLDSKVKSDIANQLKAKLENLNTNNANTNNTNKN